MEKDAVKFELTVTKVGSGWDVISHCIVGERVVATLYRFPPTFINTEDAKKMILEHAQNIVEQLESFSL